MKKVGSVIIKIIFTLLTLLFGVLTAFQQSLYNQAADSDKPLIQYEGKIYEQEELMEVFASDRNFFLTGFIIFLVITVIIFAVGIIKKKKNNA